MSDFSVIKSKEADECFRYLSPANCNVQNESIFGLVTDSLFVASRCRGSDRCVNRFSPQSADGWIEGNASALVDEDAKAIQELGKKLEPQLPKGWSIAVSRESLTMQRDEKALLMPRYGVRARLEDETDEEYFKDMGAVATLEVKLEFVPRLSDEAWLELSARNAHLLENGKDGFRNKTELGEHASLVEKYRVPNFETADFSIFQSSVSPWSRIVDDQVDQELKEVLAMIKKTFPVNRGMTAVADRPNFRWPQVWIDTENTASDCLNKTIAQPLTSTETLEWFVRDENTGVTNLNPKWAETIDWEKVPDFETWIKSRPELARLARKPRDASEIKPRVEVVRISKRQVEAKITNTVGYAMGRGYQSVAKHFRIRRTPEVDALLGLANIEVQHLTTYKGIGKHDAKAGVLKQLGEPDHVRSLQNYSSYEYYFEENVTLFYRGRQVHTVTLDVPDHVKEEAN